MILTHEGGLKIPSFTMQKVKLELCLQLPLHILDSENYLRPRPLLWVYVGRNISYVLCKKKKRIGPNHLFRVLLFLFFFFFSLSKPRSAILKERKSAESQQRGTLLCRLIDRANLFIDLLKEPLLHKYIHM